MHERVYLPKICLKLVSDFQASKIPMFLVDFKGL
uniref:Uncharacterized protein n=1 Tax=Rhizophora mucronata TaxID=61149 RepID=A0A2P2L632_RHIMU